MKSSLTLMCVHRAQNIKIHHVAAVLTPPDIISQIGLAVPLLGLYEISILAATWMARKKDDDKKT